MGWSGIVMCTHDVGSTSPPPAMRSIPEAAPTRQGWSGEVPDGQEPARSAAFSSWQTPQKRPSRAIRNLPNQHPPAPSRPIPARRDRTPSSRIPNRKGPDHRGPHGADRSIRRRNCGGRGKAAWSPVWRRGSPTGSGSTAG